MSEGTEPTRTVREEGVTVRKTVDGDGEVTVEVASERETAGTVRVVDPTLESHAESDVEFRAGDDAVEVVEGTPLFEWELGPEERRTLRYRLPDVGPEEFDTEPRVSVTGSGLDGIVDRDRSEALREFVGGERDSLAPEAVGGETEPEPNGTTVDDHAEATPAAGAAEPERVDATEGSAVEGAEATDDATDEVATAEKSAASEDAGSDGGETAPEVGEDSAGSEIGSDSVARALLEELRDGRVEEATATELRTELGTEARRSQEVRIGHLQSEVSDLAAYGDTIESFIDRHGTFEAVIDDVHDELSALDDRSERLDERIEALSEAADRVDGLDSEVTEIRSTQSELSAGIDDVREAQSEIESRMERFDGELSDVQDRLDDLELFSERITDALQGDRGPES